MANLPNFIVNDYGLTVTFVIQKKDSEGRVVVRPIDGSTSQEVHFTDPNGTVIIKPASFVTDGTDGAFVYTIEAGLLNIAGLWEARGKVITTGTQEYRTDKLRFRVSE